MNKRQRRREKETDAMSRSRAVVTAAAAAASLALATELQTAEVAGSSMMPTFATETKLLVELFSTALGRVSRGDVVILRSPESLGESAAPQLLTKRVVGVGGDWLFSREGRLVRVPTSHLWVEGEDGWLKVAPDLGPRSIAQPGVPAGVGCPCAVLCAALAG